MAQLFHIRTINGSVPPIPKELKIALYALDDNSYRSASGLLIRNKIADKIKLFLTFVPMNKVEMTLLLNIFKSDNFVITYEDIFTGVVKSGNFYHNDLEISPRWIKNEANTDVLYDVFSINLIEY